MTTADERTRRVLSDDDSISRARHRDDECTASSDRRAPRSAPGLKSLESNTEMYGATDEGQVLVGHVGCSAPQMSANKCDLVRY